MVEATEVNGASLFEDLEPGLRNLNRAKVLFNILDTNKKEEKVAARGLHESIQYMNAIPMNDRKAVIQHLTALLTGEVVDG